jgi:glycosyltransferase involved in cell wall biosynthesis
LFAGGSETVVVLSVVVPCRDRAGLLDACLVALTESVSADDEIIVVDSASAGAEVAAVAVDRGARLVRSGWPGTSRARNLGARAAAGDAIAFVDDDVRVSPGWASALRVCLAAHPEAAFITGRVAVPRHQRDAHRPVAVADHDRPLEFAGVDSAVLGHGANMAVRRRPFDAVGGFDESFGPGARYRAAEDHDLFDRLLAAGFAGRYEPAVAAEHEQWRQRWALVGLEWAYGVGTGARLERLRRTSPALARNIVAASLWRDGLRTIPRSLRDGHELNVAFVGARLAATVAGFGTALLRSR